MKTFFNSLLITVVLALAAINPIYAEWEQTNGPYGGSVACLAASSNGNLFAGTWGWGLFRSADNGESWSEVNIGLTEKAVSTLIFSPDETNIFAGTANGVFRSTDNGENWTAVNNGLQGKYVRISAFVFTPDGATLFATSNIGVLRSTDNGESWDIVNNGLTGNYSIIGCLAANDVYIYAGTGTGLFRSADNGENWSEVIGLTGKQVSTLIFSPNGTNLIAGTWNGEVYLSKDMGDNWIQIQFADYMGTITSLIVKDETVFFRTPSTVFRSNDNGINWDVANNGLTNSGVQCLAIKNTNIFAGTSNGVFRSTDNGVNWTRTANTGMNVFISSLAVKGDDIFAGAAGEIFRSTDNGANWIPIGNSQIPSASVRHLIISHDGANLFAGLNAYGVFRSTNNGAHWTEVNTGLTDTDINSMVFSGTDIFVGTRGGVFRSTNNGANWTAVNNGITDFSIWALAVCNSNIFAGTTNGVFRSTNNGVNWTQINAGLTITTDINAFGVYGNYLLAGTNGGGIFLLAGNDTNWIEVNSGLTDFKVWSFAVSDTNIFAGTSSGVFLSTNKGANWTAVNTSLPNTYVGELAAKGTNLFAAGSFLGVWRRPLSEMITSVKFLSDEIPSLFKLEQNYPNPFNPSTKINFSIPQTSHVSIKVYDLLGKEVGVLVNDELHPGNYEAAFNGTGLASGVYFYQLRAGSFTQTRKLVLMK